MGKSKVGKAREVSSGGVVFRTLRGEPVVALCRRWRGRVWCLPKGGIEPGETVKEAALREVREETGVVAQILQRLGETRYRYRRSDTRGNPVEVAKRVTFYLMVRREGNIAHHDHEVEQVRWYSLPDALDQATFPSERMILRKAAMRIRQLS